jgi:hypothetical protein
MSGQMEEVTQSWLLVSQAFQTWKQLTYAKNATAADDEAALRRLKRISELAWHRYSRRSRQAISTPQDKRNGARLVE